MAGQSEVGGLSQERPLRGPYAQAAARARGGRIGSDPGFVHDSQAHFKNCLSNLSQKKMELIIPAEGY